MPVAARVVSDRLIVAAITSFEMTAERSRSASADVAQYLALLVRDYMAPALKELVLVIMEDIGHFQPMSCHADLSPPWAVRIIRMGRSSSGLGVACSLASETCRYREVVSRSRWPSKSWMLRRSVPASSRWEAKECRSTCGLRGLLRPNCSRS